MERKVGEIFFLKNSWYQVVRGIGCNNCDIRYYDYGQYCMFKDTVALRGYCSKLIREDKTPVIFKKLEKIGEPYIIEGKKIQKYRVFHTPYIYHKIDCSWQSFADPCYIGLEIK